MNPLEMLSEERDLRSTVAAIARNFGHRRFAECAAQGEFPHQLWDALSDGGFTGVNFPTEFGGGGGTLGHLGAVAEEVAAAGCPLMTLVVSPAVCGPIIEKYGTQDQRRQWLPGLASGRLRMSFAITESDAGSNSHNISTRARAHGGGWTIDGEKAFISGVDEASSMIVVARTGVDATDRALLSLFIVPVDAEGVAFVPIRTHVQAAERQFSVRFDGVRLSDQQLIGEVGAGLRQLFHGLNAERIMSAATCVGIGRYALDKAAAYARQRKVWGVPIGAHQGIAHPLAKALVSIEAASLLTLRAASMFDEGRDCASAASMAKYAAAEAASEAVDAAIQTHGGNGLTYEYGIADLWGLSRLYGIAPLSREMTLNHLATHALGLPKSY